MSQREIMEACAYLREWVADQRGRRFTHWDIDDAFFSAYPHATDEDALEVCMTMQRRLLAS